MIWAVVLAAGESRRMGTQKLLLPFGGSTVVGAVVAAALGSRVEGALVVLGADRDAVRREIEASLGEGRGSSDAGAATRAGGGLGPGRAKGAAGNALGPDERVGRGALSRAVTFAVNKDYRQGMLSSIKAGFRALPADAEAAVVMLGDQPFVAPGVIDRVIEAFEKEGGAGKSIVVPTVGGRRGHPPLIDMKHRDEVLGLDPADGLRQLMWAHPGDILEIEVGDADILRDLDTPADYQDGVKPTLYPKMGKV